VYVRGARRPFAFVADRAHHADIGGMEPGSMPVGTDIFQEGVRVPPIKLVAGGHVVDDVLALFLANTRVPHERRGDLDAQCAALRVGATRVAELAERVGGTARLARDFRALQDHAERLMRAMLRRLPAGTYRATDVLDDDGHGARNLRIRVAITLRGGRARVDFTGTAPQVRGPVNANLAVTRSAVLYVFAALAGGGVPTNDGIARPLDIVAPEGTLVHALAPAAVAGGNVETSQRIVVLLRALTKAALTACRRRAGLDEQRRARRRAPGPRVRVLRTLAGGAGGGPGVQARQTHRMTNTMNTRSGAQGAYPLRVAPALLGSGRGRWRSGDGLVRQLRLRPRASRRLSGGRSPVRARGRRAGSARSQRMLVRGGRDQTLPGKVTLDVRPGDRLRVETPTGAAPAAS
jgi:N-methylhydantoinase B